MSGDNIFGIVCCIFAAVLVVGFALTGAVVVLNPSLRVINIDKPSFVVNTYVHHEFKVYSSIRRYNIK